MSHGDTCPGCGGEPAGAAGELCPGCLAKLEAREDNRTTGSTITMGDEHREKRETTAHPEWIGRYRILSLLGEGGMGIVYLAEQVEPLARRVALKVIRPGMDSREVLLRFARERQALAVMNHPNIARVFDAGVTEEGRSYFVMEYAAGTKITDYCDLHCLSVAERVALFTDVCDAVQHAHQKGVIHRDIKPSNVLVATEDGRPVAKVIDFGLSKGTEWERLERTASTRQGELLGTPEYMSPEQAGMTGADVDARTDIYSLGVLLYELVVGALPFDPATLRRAAVVEMLRIIQQEDPPTPWKRLSAMGATAAEIARRRHTDVRSLGRELRGELEWITLRAMAKEPARRYASASELSADLARHLAGEPVAAGPPSRSYRLRKLVKKHAVVVVAAAMSFLILLAGTVVSSLLYVRAEAARQRAASEATRSALEARALQAALLGDLRGYDAMSAEALELYRKLSGEESAELPAHAVNRLVILDLLRGELGPPEDDEQRRSKLRQEAVALVDRALERGDQDSLRSAALLAELLPPGPSDALARKVLAAADGMLPNLDEATIQSLETLARRVETAEYSPPSGSDDEALERFDREVLARRSKILPPGSPGLVEAQRSLALVLEGKGARLQRAGEAHAAERAFREALGLVGESGVESHGHGARLASDLGEALTSLGKFAEAERLLLDARRTLEASRGENNATTHVTIERLEKLYRRWNRPDEASRIRAALPPIFVEASAELGVVTFDDGTIFGEGGRSVSLGERSVWILGESEYSMPGKDSTSRRRSSLAWTAGLDGTKQLRLHVDRTTPELLTLTGDERAFNAVHSGADCVEPCGAIWTIVPESAVADRERGRLLVFYRRVLTIPPQREETVGSSIAVCSTEGGCERPVFDDRAIVPTLLFGPDEPAWGSAALVAGGHLYAYACDVRGLETTCRLARAPLAAALDRSAWQFFAGDGHWSAEWREARPILAGGIQWGVMSVHWNEYMEKYVAISSRVLDARISVRVADHPEGPWSDPLTEIDTLRSGPGWFWTTWGIAHPELSRDGGRVEYVTYRRNTERSVELRLLEITFGRK